MEQYLTLSELAQNLSLSTSTVSKYCKRYAQFLESEQKGRQKVYPPKTVELLRQINQAYKDHISTEQIKKQIFKPVGNKTAQPTPQSHVTEAAATVTKRKSSTNRKAVAVAPAPPAPNSKPAIPAAQLAEIQSDLKQLQSQQQEAFKLMEELEKQFKHLNPLVKWQD